MVMYFYLIKYIFLLQLFIYMLGEMSVPYLSHGGQSVLFIICNLTYRSVLFPSTKWIPEIEICQIWQQSAFIHWSTFLAQLYIFKIYLLANGKQCPFRNNVSHSFKLLNGSTYKGICLKSTVGLGKNLPMLAFSNTLTDRILHHFSCDINPSQ